MYNRRINDERAAGRELIDIAVQEARTSAPLARGNAAGTGSVLSPELEANPQTLGNIEGGGWSLDPDTGARYWGFRLDFDALDDSTVRLG